jgi:putative nucleotidyltransferase with HDIG domain
MTIVNGNLKSYIGRLKTLPTAPGVLVKLITVFQESDRDIDEVAVLIHQDPSLTADVLRYANSAFFVREDPVVDIFEAIAWVGFSQVYQAVVAKLASQALRLPKDVSGLNVDQIWNHSAAAAVYASAIARELQENEGLVFTAGLLHDVGKIVLSLAEGVFYSELIAKDGSHGSLLQKEEKLLFGFGHAEVGASLLNRWGLPEDISEPVRQHHQTGWAGPRERICAMVSLGNIMAHAGDETRGGNHYGSEEAISALAALQMKESDADKLLQASQNDIKRMAEAFGAGAK